MAEMIVGCKYEEFFEDEASPSAGFLADCQVQVVGAAGTPLSDVIAAHRVIRPETRHFTGWSRSSRCR
jgi:hypothetical protein